MKQYQIGAKNLHQMYQLNYDGIIYCFSHSDQLVGMIQKLSIIKEKLLELCVIFVESA